MYERAGLPDPATVALHTDGTGWVDAQVRAEFDVLFPDAQVVLNPEPAPYDLVVLVSSAGPESAAVREWARRNQRHASVALGFYRLDPRRFDVVAPAGADAWLTRRRLEHAAGAARSRFPRLWGGAARAYGRCASYS